MLTTHAAFIAANMSDKEKIEMKKTQDIKNEKRKFCAEQTEKGNLSIINPFSRRNTEALKIAGDCRFHGFGESRDVKGAMEYYRESRNTDALCMLYICNLDLEESQRNRYEFKQAQAAAQTRSNEIEKAIYDETKRLADAGDTEAATRLRTRHTNYPTPPSSPSMSTLASQLNDDGEWLLTKSSYSTALTAFNAALFYCPFEPSYLANKGKALYHLQRYDEAQAVFKFILRFDETDDFARSMEETIRLRRSSAPRINVASLTTAAPAKTTSTDAAKSVKESEEAKQQEARKEEEKKREARLALIHRHSKTVVDVRPSSTTTSTVKTAEKNIQPPTEKQETLTPEMIAYLGELKSSGLTLDVLNEFKQQLQQSPAANLNEIKRMQSELLKRQSQLEKDMEAANDRLDNSPEAKAEKAYIAGDVKLQNYERRLTKELGRFFLAYFIALSNVLTVQQNRVGQALTGASGLPVAGIFLKPITATLGLLNDRHQMSQFNHTDLFKTPTEIADVVCKLARQVTIAKRDEIRGQTTFVPSGVVGRIQGLYKTIATTVKDELKSLRKSNTSGRNLEAEEELAMLHCALLFRQLFVGKPEIPSGTPPEELIKQFLKIIFDNADFNYVIPDDVKAAPTTPAVTLAPAAGSNNSSVDMMSVLAMFQVQERRIAALEQQHKQHADEVKASRDQVATLERQIAAQKQQHADEVKALRSKIATLEAKCRDNDETVAGDCTAQMQLSRSAAALPGLSVVGANDRLLRLEAATEVLLATTHQLTLGLGEVNTGLAAKVAKRN